MKERKLRLKFEAEKEKGNFKKAADIANELAFLYSNHGNLEEAYKCHQDDLDMCLRIDDLHSAALSYKNIAEIEVQQRKYEAAANTTKRCLRLVKETDDVENEARCYQTFGYIYINQYTCDMKDKSLLDKSIKYTKKLLSLEELEAKRLGPELAEMRGRAYMNLSIAYLLRGDYEESLRTFSKAERYLKDGKKELFYLYHGTSNYLMGTEGDFARYFPRALDLANKALKILRNRDKEYVDAVMTKAKILILNKQFADAVDCLREAYEFHPKNLELIKIFKVVVKIIEEEDSLLKSTDKSKSFEIIGDVLDRIVYNLYEKRRFAYLSIHYYNESLTALQQSQRLDPKTESGLYQSIAQCYEDAGELYEAEQNYRIVLKLEVGNAEEQCKTLSQLANCMWTNKDFSEVHSVINSWVSLAEQENLLQQRVFSLQMLEKFFEENYKTEESVAVRSKLDKILSETNLTEDEICSMESSQSSAVDLLADVELDQHRKRNTNKRKFKPVDNKGQYLLHHLVRKKGSEDQIRTAIQQGHPLDVKDHAGWSPLGDAMEKGSLSYVQILISSGADINMRQPEQNTPLMLAAAAGFLDVCEYLLRQGADPSLKNESELTALSYLRRHRIEEKDTELRVNLDNLIRVIEDKYKTLGRTVDRTVAPAESDDEQNSLEPASVTYSPAQQGGHLDRTAGFEALRKKRSEKARASKSLGETFRDSAVKSQRGHLNSSDSETDEDNFHRPSAGRRGSDPTEFRSSSTKRRFGDLSDGTDSNSDKEPSSRFSFNQLKRTHSKGKRKAVSPQELKTPEQLFKKLSSHHQDSGSRHSGQTGSHSTPRMTTSTQRSSVLDFPEEPQLSQIHHQNVGGSGVHMYQAAMDQLRHTKPRVDTASSSLTGRKSDSEDDNFTLPDDWLVDDLKLIREEKERRRQERQEEKKPSKLKRRRRMSKENIISQIRIPPQDEKESSSQSSSRPTQSPTPDLPEPTSPILVKQFSKRSKIQPKIDSLLPHVPSPVLNYRENLPHHQEPIRSCPSIQSHTPKVPLPSLTEPHQAIRRIKVRIAEKTMLIPLKEDDLTVGWLAREASERYGRSEGKYPEVRLVTSDGAQLESTDLLQDVVNGSEILQGEVTFWKMMPPHQRYKQICEETGSTFFTNLSRSIQRAELTHSLKISVPMKQTTVMPLIRSLKSWSALRELTLSGCKLHAGIDVLKSVLSSLSCLVTLDLSNNSLVPASLVDLRPPSSLASLNLNHNIFGNSLLKYLNPVLTCCPNLTSLQLSHCSLSQNVFESGRTELTAAITGLKEIDVSGNILDPLGIEILMQCLPATLRHLNISSTVKGSYPFILRGLASFCSRGNPETDLETVSLRNCHLSDVNLQELSDSLQHLGRLKKLDLSGNSFAGAALGQLLDKLYETESQLSSLLLDNCDNLIDKGWEDFFSTIKSIMEWHTKLQYLSFPDSNPMLIKSMRDVWENAWSTLGSINNDSSKNIVFTVI